MRNQILAITYGSMYVALGAVAGIMNLFTGGFFDVLLTYLLTVALMLYGYYFNIAKALLSALALFLVLMMLGNLFFAGYTILTVGLGVVLAHLIKINASYCRSLLMIAGLAIVKNVVVFIVLGELFLLNGMQEARELTSLLGFDQDYVWFVYGATPILIGAMESVIINNYSRFILLKFHRHYRKGK